MRPRSIVGSVLVSALVLLTFCVMLFFVASRSVPTGNEAIAHTMLGGLVTIAGNVVAYWTGSIYGSRVKDAMMADAQTALANSTPVPAAERIVARIAEQTEGRSRVDRIDCRVDGCRCCRNCRLVTRLPRL